MINWAKNNKVLHIKMTLLEDMLGGRPGNDDILETYIASKAPNAKTMKEELEDRSMEEIIQDRITGFERQNGCPFIYDYHIKGFLKEAWKVCKSISGSECSKKKAYKSLIDNQIFIKERRLFFYNPDGMKVKEDQLTTCQRPLRADTMQGPRVSIAKSEAVPAGSYLSFEVEVMDPSLVECLKECFSYSEYKALGQWRSSGKGRCFTEITEVKAS